MSDPKRIAYRYVGPEKYRGIPANDLTEERVSALSLKLQAALNQPGSPYKRVEPEKADEKQPASKAKSQKTEEVN